MIEGRRQCNNESQKGRLKSEGNEAKIHNLILMETVYMCIFINQVIPAEWSTIQREAQKINAGKKGKDKAGFEPVLKKNFTVQRLASLPTRLK